MPCPVRRQTRLALAALMLLGWAFTAQPAAGQFKCFPSCSSADARFLVIASGTELVTLSEEVLEVQFAVPANQASFSLGVFDGDGGGVDGGGIPHWDLGENVPYSYTLYADPTRDGSGTTIVNMSPGVPVTSSATMLNNAWKDFTISTSPIAQAPSGNFFYRLEIRLLDNSGASYNAFKLRTDGVVSIRLADQPFSYIASLGTFDEVVIIYPSFPLPIPTTYDGVFRFFFDIPQSLSQIAVWDGDFDYGDSTGLLTRDTDDPDTPNSPFLPAWATADSVSEGVAEGLLLSTGNPPDDNDPLAALFLRPPSIFEQLIFPDGQVFTNSNPSGNQEWEQFLISTNPGDLADDYTASIPSGTYELRLQGVDLSNLNALRLPAEALCVSENFEPCEALRPFLVEGTVITDCNPESDLEPPLGGVTVELVDSLGTVVATQTTAADGTYAFPVEAGTYTVQIADSNYEPGGPLETYTATSPTTQTVEVDDSNASNVDFGFCGGTGSIGDRVWLDNNNNGIQDPGEPGIPDVFLMLWDQDGNVLDAIITDSDGFYTFLNVPAGSYTIEIDQASIPPGLVPTYDLDGIGTPHLAGATLGNQQERTDVDFGYGTGPGGTASLGDLVWYDADGDGVQDPGEPGLASVTVRLLDDGGNEITTTVTDANGVYTFSNLEAGTYAVAVDTATLPAGLTPTYDLDGIATPHFAVVILAEDANRTDVDFGYRGTASLGDRVWYDTNGNGAQDAGENGLTGVTVELLDNGGNVIATTTTAADGIYGFANLNAGSYTVRVVAATLPAGATPTYDLDGAFTAHTAAATLTAGQNRTDVDFGYRGTSFLGDRVWYDTNGDGVQDAGENGLTGVTVELLDGDDNVIATTTTAADGIYNFNYIFGGTYTVRVVAATLPAGVAPTYDLDGVGTAHTAEVTVAGGQTRNDVDFGYRGNGSLGDRVWYDTNGDGVQDAGENGMTGVTVELLDDGGNVVATTTTAADGIYTFSNLAAGTYTVRVVAASLPAGVAPTYDLDGIPTAHTAEAALTAGQNRTDVDFGYRGTASLGDRVWYDTNGDGIQDPGEDGLTGVTVILEQGGNFFASTVTGADGIYTFSGLEPGSYRVVIDNTTLPAGVAPTYDLDGIATAHTAEATLTAGQDRTDVDFGYRGTASLGDRVWYDTDGDGTQEAGENGLTGVTVELLDNGGNVIATTTTAADGIYTFDNLAAGTYTVRVVAASLPAGVVPTYDLNGIATAHTAEATLTAGQDRTDVDFGYRGTASLGDRVWYDADGNGTQDAGENGLTGVTVELLDNGGNVVATTTTAADGIYTFDNLAAGTYTVRVVAASLPAGVAPTYDLDGIATAHTAEATLTGGQDRTDVDFGYRGTASLGDRVWYDADGDGTQEAGENGLTGVTVELLDNGGNVVATTTTAADGIYTFSNLAAGSYTVRVVSATLPAGSAPTFDLDGIATAHTAAVTLTGGQNRTDVDFGYRGTASLGDRVWFDTDADGIQDAGENGLTGVTVELLSGTTVVATTTTGADGIYTFSNLSAGSYTVRVVSSTLPAGVAPTYDLDGIATAHTAAATVTGGQNRTDVDFGYRGTGSIGDRVWFDTDADGIQDAGENGLTGVTVELLNGTTVVATTTTGANGIYTFSNLAAGSYTVRVVSATLPAGVAPTYDLDGIATAHTAAVTLTAGQNRTDADFGYKGTGSIGDRLWNDADADGIQDAGEAGLTGVTVELLSGTTVVATTTTGADGIYTFSNLAAGSYTVRVVSATLPAGSAPTYDLDGIATAHTAAVTLTAGQNRTDVDFGYRGTASLGDRLWNDVDGDGVQDAGEAGLTGVTVELLSGTTVIATTTTGADGIYTFSNLAAGSYTVRVVSATLPAGSAPTYDLDGIATAHTAAVTVTGGQNRTDVDFGYRGTASIGDRVWFDTDADGIQDAGENGLTGVTVELLSGTTVVATTTTGANGIYTFSNLAAGSYTVRVVSATLPAGVAPTYDLDGIATAHTAAVTVTGGQNRTDVDFGYKGTGSIGDRLWNDADADGVQDAGEAGLTGVTVELLSGTTVVATTTTGANGIYTFDNLAAGSYTVRVVSATLPAGSAPTYDLDGIATAHTAAVTLTAGQARTDVDFGYRGTASLGDRVWNDVDADGVQDAGEAGLTGVTVELLSGTTVVATTTTGADGIYTFSNLAAGSYTVRVVSATLPAGSAPTYDLDGIATAHTAAVTVTGGQNRTDVDFGYRGTASIGDRVWFDTDADGVQDAGENGLTGVTVELLSGTTVVATTTTGANGIYTFSNLAAGSYTVRVVSATLPAGSAPTYDLDGIATAHTAAVTVTGGQNRTDVDFGYKGTGSIGDRLWNDANANGVQDAGEAGLTGVTVELLSGTTVIATATTGANGIYTFDNLAAGSYTVRVVSATLPAGSAPTYDLDGIATAHTAAVTLTAGQARTDVDFGYRGTASIGDRVWNDADGDGIQEAGEAGLTGVTVELLSGTTVVATTTTGADGIYTFSNLAAGSYTVRVVSATLPAGAAPTYDLDGIATAHTAAVTVTGGQNRTDVDFGYRGTASIGDRVWFDTDADGVQDAGENGLTGVTVELLSGTTVVATTTTGANGIYTFSNLAAGTYTVRVVSSTLPAGSAPTYDLDGIATAHTAAVTVTGGQNRTDVDFGYKGTSSIGDRLWNDANGDGVQDAGETGLTGVTVELLSGTTVVATTTTGANGIYTFSNLAAGSYTVRVVSSTLPAGTAPTYDLDGTATAHTAAVTVTAGQTRTDVDFGYRGTASIGDRVWNDADGDGIQEAGEAGLTGVTVELLSGTTVVATTTTGADGIYNFSNLTAGSYTVRVVSSTLPAGSAPTYDLDGIATAHTAAVTVTAGQTRTDVDFGYRGTASIGDRVWNDADADGVQDAGETGLTGVTVELLSGTTVVASTTTGANGIYTFSNLAAGTYTVRVVSSTLPAGSAPTFDLDGIATAHTAAVTVTGGQNRTDVDFGYKGTASIGDRVWFDADADGVQDAGEAGLTGVTVELLSGTTVVASTTTGANGIYTFSNLAAGTYTVRVVSATLPAGSAPTYDLDGIATAHTAAVTVTGGQTRTDVDFGYKGTASIGDRVWLDADGDGVQDAGETGLTGVTVELLSGTTVIASTATGANGIYTFGNLAAGSYTVRVVSATLPAGVTPTFDLDGIATAHTAAVTVTAGQVRTDVDFGYKGTGSIGDRLWNDVDGDGVQDSGETGLTGVTVELLSGTTVVATTTTGTNGAYTFSNLAAGSYTVRVVSSTLPAGVVPTYDLDGIATAHTAAATLTAGQNRTDVDFGYRTPPVSCTPGYYKDHFNSASFSNNDGTLNWAGAWIESDSAGAGVSAGNVTVGSPYAGYLFLRDYPDTGSQPSAARQANLTGFTSATLSFYFHVRTAVDPDDAVVVEISNNGGSTYTVLETLNGFTGTAEAGRSYNLSSAYLVSNFRVRFRVSNSYGASDELFKLDWIKLDGNCTGNASIGDRLWYDIDGDGAQDSGEFGLPGVTVELLSGTSVIASTTTDSNGIYTFDNLLAGNYTVRVVTSTFPVGGLTPTYDLDGTGTAHTAAVTLASGSDRTDVDFGYRGSRSLGDRVWNDADNDGVQDSSEAGINGVTVRLFLGTTEVGSTVTAGNGNYTFANLPETTFIVRIDTATLPAGMTQTYDLDGTSSAHQATVNLTANRTDVDFGYRTPPVSCTAGYYKDHFDSASFSNNNGTLNWAGSWIESDSAGAGVSAGNVTVGSPYAGYLFLRDYPDTGTEPSAARQANLSGFASATLSIYFHVRTGVDPSDAVVVEISNNGGSTYTVLDTLEGYTGTDEDTFSYSIPATHLVSNFRVRFRVSNGYGASDELFKLDWIKLEGYCGSAPATGSIGNRVWKDTDGDGTQDSGEAGINGATVQLLNSSGTVIATTTTAGNGDYTFSSVAAGNYSVRVVSSTLPSGLTPSYDLDGTGTAHISAVTLTSGQHRSDVDFGYKAQATSCTEGYFKDHFNSASFSNNDGTLNWAGSWIESDSAGTGVSSGNVTVGSPYAGYLFLRDYPDTGTQPSAARQANLTGFTSATLSFSFHVRTAVDPDDAVVIEISKNGGSTYTVLDTLDGYTGTDEDTFSYNISSYIASNTRIRFRVSSNYGASDELFKLDWVKISGDCD